MSRLEGVGRLGIGDRVRVGGGVHTVVAVSGTMVRLADTSGGIIEARPPTDAGGDPAGRLAR